MINLTGKVWLISDTHLGHNNIVDYCGRPLLFADIIWSKLKRVGPDDTLIHCGDVAFINKKVNSSAKEICGKLPGSTKILEIGRASCRERV